MEKTQLPEHIKAQLEKIRVEGNDLFQALCDRSAFWIWLHPARTRRELREWAEMWITFWRMMADAYPPVPGEDPSP